MEFARQRFLTRMPLLLVLLFGHAEVVWTAPPISDPDAASLAVVRPFPPVERALPTQRHAMAELRNLADAASSAATSRLLALLDSDGFRANLRSCCSLSGIASWSARRLLEELRANVQASELVHNFDGQGHAGLNLDLAFRNATEYMPTSWQMLRLGYLGDPEQAKFGHPASPADAAEEGIFRLRPFTGPYDLPVDYAEASSRLHYVMLNLFRVDVGNPGWGQVAAVLSPSYWADAVAVAPVSTGIYTFCCNDTYMRSPGSHLCRFGIFNQTCSKEEMTPGVSGAMDHAILAHLVKLDGRSLSKKLFARWCGDSPLSLTAMDTLLFMESNILANIRYADDGVKLLVGAFGPLFGTARGMLLRDFASRNGVAVAWALGPGLANATVDLELGDAYAFRTGEMRILDVSSNMASLNVSSLARSTASRRRAEAALADVWAEADAARLAAGGDSTLSHERILELWEAAKHAVPSEALFNPPAAWGCEDWDSCLGTTVLGDCICYHRRRPRFSEADTIVA